MKHHGHQNVWIWRRGCPFGFQCQHVWGTRKTHVHRGQKALEQGFAPGKGSERETKPTKSQDFGHVFPENHLFPHVGSVFASAGTIGRVGHFVRCSFAFVTKTCRPGATAHAETSTEVSCHFAVAHIQMYRNCSLVYPGKHTRLYNLRIPSS